MGLFALLLVLASLGSRAQLPAPASVWRLAPDSPLATEGRSLFAVAEDRRTVVVRPLKGGGAWNAFGTDIPVDRIGGLAIFQGALYVSDSDAAALYRIDLGSHQATRIWQGSPLRRPTDLVVIGGTIQVADPASVAVFRSPLPIESLRPIEVSRELLAEGPVFLTASEEDLILASPLAGKVFEVLQAGQIPNTRFSVLQKSVPNAPSSVKGAAQADGTGPPDTLRISGYEEIKRPTAIAFYQGIVYVVDDASQQVYAFSRHGRRPVRLVANDMPVRRPTRLLATSDDLYVLDGESQELVVWPRMIPTEVRFEVATLSESMAEFYFYLLKRKVLPTRTVLLHQNIEKTLKAEKVLLAPYVDQLDVLLCELNRSLCKSDRIRQVLQEGQPLTVPDLYTESYIDVRRIELIELDGSRNLGQEVDRRIRSPEFEAWKTEERLRRLNVRFAPDTSQKAPLDIREMRAGIFSIPIEFVRYVVAIPSADLKTSSSELRRIERRYVGLSIIPLEEVFAKKYGEAQDPDERRIREELQTAHRRMLKTIGYGPMPPGFFSVTPYVGVAEAEVDCENPDLKDTAGSSVCETVTDELSPVPAGGMVATPSQKLRTKDFENFDHGTMVASLIAARNTQFEGTGLAPMAPVVVLHDKEPAIGDDIRSALLNLNTHIFNLSLHFGDKVIPPKLKECVDNYADALFVVAAGNDGVELCKGIDAYPACWGDRKNVLVVAATNLDGTALLSSRGAGAQQFRGSNWSEDYVAVAAPGEGFYASGRNRSYVPVLGTSFATPLVTATAALLYAQGVSDPWLIKQRIVATSDWAPNLKGKVKGGLLNVSRAVTLPRKAHLVDDTGRTTFVEIVPTGQVLFRWPTGSALVPIKNVRRVTRTGATFRVVYVQGEKLEVQEQVSFAPAQPWKFKYFNIDPNTKARVGARLDGDLANFADYVGPIS